MPSLAEELAKQNQPPMAAAAPTAAVPTPAAVPIPTSERYEAADVTIRPEDTVEGRIKRIIDQRSPLVQQAELAAKQEAQKRGLLSSSMALQAGRQAVISQALPIAQQDSAQALEAAARTAEARDRAAQFNIGTQAQFQLEGQRGGQAIEQIREQTEAESRLMAERGDIERQLLTADTESKIRLMNRQGEIERELQELRGGQAIEQIREQGELQKYLTDQEGNIRSRLMDQQADIDERLLAADAGTRIQLLQEQAELDRQLREQDAAIQSRLLDQKAQIDLQLQGADAETRFGLLQQQGEIDKALRAQEGDIQMRLERERSRLQQRLIQAEGIQKTELLREQGAIDKELTQLRTDAELRMMDRKGEIDRMLQDADAETRKELLDQQFALDTELRMGLSDKQKEVEIDLMNRKKDIDKEMLTADTDARSRLLEEQAFIDATLRNLDYENETKLIGTRTFAEVEFMKQEYEQRTGLALIEGNMQQELTRIEGDYKRLLQTSQSAAMIYSEAMGRLIDIQLSEVIGADDKTALIGQLMNQLGSGLRVIEAAGGVEIDEITNFDWWLGATGVTATGTGGGAGTGGTGTGPGGETIEVRDGRRGYYRRVDNNRGGTRFEWVDLGPADGAVGGTGGDTGGTGEPELTEEERKQQLVNNLLGYWDRLQAGETTITTPTGEVYGPDHVRGILNSLGYDISTLPGAETSQTGGDTPPAQQPPPSDTGGQEPPPQQPPPQPTPDETFRTTFDQGQTAFREQWGAIAARVPLVNQYMQDTLTQQLQVANDPNLTIQEKEQKIYEIGAFGTKILNDWLAANPNWQNQF